MVDFKKIMKERRMTDKEIRQGLFIDGEDGEPQRAESPDRLELMMRLQEQLSDRVSISVRDFQEASTPVKVVWITRYFIAAIVELVEMLNCIPWKWWKKHQNWDNEELKKEWVDVFHFVLNIGILLGFTPDTLLDAYMEKNIINHKRQDNGY